MTIPFTKAHGAKNDFLLTWATDAPAHDRSAIAVAICDRYTGVGADGWMIVSPAESGAPAAIQLFNSDGSEPELSGNGTRCAAALLLASHACPGPEIVLQTGAGAKELILRERNGNEFLFEMNMGFPKIAPGRLQYTLEALGRSWDCTILDVGNPQCAVFAHPHPPSAWQSLGAAIERHALFPNRTNVSFVRPLDGHSIDVLFFERGAGETMSSGTGSTGAASAALARGLVESPVRVVTPAGELTVRFDEDGTAFLTGPAEIVAEGLFFFSVR